MTSSSRRGLSTALAFSAAPAISGLDFPFSFPAVGRVVTGAIDGPSTGVTAADKSWRRIYRRRRPGAFVDAARFDIRAAL